MSTPATLLKSLRAQIGGGRRDDRGGTLRGDAAPARLSPGSGALAHRMSRRTAVALTLVAALLCAFVLLAGSGVTAAEAESDACSNAEFRSQQNAEHLPDCRAYEQVSPIYKNGNHAAYAGYDNTSLAPIVASAEVEGVIYGSFGVFAGAPGGSFPTNVYAGLRGSDWETSPFSPPVSFVDPADVANNFGSTVAGTTADLSKQMVVTAAAQTAGAIEGGWNLYIHDRVDDSYELVGAVSGVNPIDFQGWNRGGRVEVAATSSDGGRWIFSTQVDLPSTPAPAPDSGTTSQYNLYEYDHGQLTLLSTLPEGTPTIGLAAPGTYLSLARRAVSSDLSQIYWTAPAGSDPNTPVYLHRAGGSTLVTERETDGTTADGIFWFASSDGSRAFLTSSDSLTADASPSGYDLYLYDRDADDLIDLTPTPNSAGVEAVLGTSDDGSRVYFQATGALTSGATAGEHNIYVWDGETLRLIATSATGIPATTQTQLDLRLDIGNYRVSPNGMYFGFTVDGELIGPHPHDDVGTAQAYLYDLAEDALDCASCPPGGSPTTGDVQFQQNQSMANNHLRTNRRGTTRNVLDDGRFYFQTPDALVAADSNRGEDVYQYAAESGEVSLISGGQSAEGSFFADASPDGKDVYFSSLAHLVGQDRDSLYDLYVAKVDGGISSQMPSVVSGCEGDACQGELSEPPVVDGPASSGYFGHGNSAGNRDRCRQVSRRSRRAAKRSRKLKRQARGFERRSRGFERRSRKTGGRRSRVASERARRLARKARGKKRSAHKQARRSKRLKRKVARCDGGSR